MPKHSLDGVGLNPNRERPSPRTWRLMRGLTTHVHKGKKSSKPLTDRQCRRRSLRQEVRTRLFLPNLNVVVLRIWKIRMQRRNKQVFCQITVTFSIGKSNFIPEDYSRLTPTTVIPMFNSLKIKRDKQSSY